MLCPVLVPQKACPNLCHSRLASLWRPWISGPISPDPQAQVVSSCTLPWPTLALHISVSSNRVYLLQMCPFPAAILELSVVCKLSWRFVLQGSMGIFQQFGGSGTRIARKSFRSDGCGMYQRPGSWPPLLIHVIIMKQTGWIRCWRKAYSGKVMFPRMNKIHKEKSRGKCVDRRCWLVSDLIIIKDAACLAIYSFNNGQLAHQQPTRSM